MQTQDQSQSLALTPQQEAMRAAVIAPPLGIAPDMRGFWKSYGKEGVPFDVAAADLEAAHRQDGGDINDVEVYDLRAMMMTAIDGRMAIANPRTGETFRLRSAAFADLAGPDHLKLNGGAKMLRDRLPPPLQLATMNALLMRAPERLPAVFRVRGGDVCAVVSNTYAALDIGDLLGITRESLQTHGTLGEARVAAIGHGLADLLRVVWPTGAITPRVNDVTQRALDFRNSSFGHASVSVMPSLFRLVCLNGAIVAEKGSKSRHAHRGKAERVMAAVKESVAGSLYEGSEAARLFAASVAVEINNVAAMFGGLTDTWGLTQAEVSTAKLNLVEDMPGAIPVTIGMPELPARTTLYDAVNAITATARMSEPDRRLELEAIGGDFLRKHAN